MFKTVLTWVDVGGRERLTVLNSLAGATETIAKLRVLSNATVTTLSEAEVTATGAALAASDLYPDLEDSWIVTCTDITGDPIQLYVPAPLASLTAVDGRTYNSGSAPWTGFASFLAAMNHPYTSAPLTAITTAQIVRATPDAFMTWTQFSTAIDWARRTLQWADVHGNTRLTHLIGDVASLGPNFDDVMAAMQAVSNAVVTHYWESAMNIYADAPTTDMYNSVNDECRITFDDGYGNLTTVIVPAPNRAIFMADGKTLDQLQANVIDFIGAAETELMVPISGHKVDHQVNGILGKRTVY